MLIASIITLTVGILLIVTDRTNLNNLIFSSILFAVTMGLFGSYMEIDLIPYLKSQEYVSSSHMIFLEYLCSFLLSCGHFIPCSAFFLFSLYFAGYTTGRTRFKNLIFSILIITPTIASFVMFPVQREFKPNFIFLSIWSGIYLFASTMIQWKAYKNATTKSEKNERNLIFVLTIVGGYSQYFFGFVTQAFGNQKIWTYTHLSTTFSFIIFIFFIIRFGVFGFRIRFEKVKMDTALKAVSSSTLIYNHAVKNEVSKISLCAHTILNLNDNIEDADCKHKITKSAEIISGSANHLLNLVERIKDSTRPIEIIETVFSLRELLENTLQEIQDTNKIKGISTKLNIHNEYKIKADYTHIRECFGNIVRNAVEAVGNNGVITISIEYQVRFLIISVKDNGPGISPEKIPFIFDPFYSTKTKSNNFGLGLFYCYNVMRKHKGNVEVKSTLNFGTTISLVFPSSRVYGKFQPLTLNKPIQTKTI